MWEILNEELSRSAKFQAFSGIQFFTDAHKGIVRVIDDDRVFKIGGIVKPETADAPWSLDFDLRVLKELGLSKNVVPALVAAF